MFSDVDEQLLLQKLFQDVFGCHVYQGLFEDTSLIIFPIRQKN